MSVSSGVQGFIELRDSIPKMVFHYWDTVSKTVSKLQEEKHMGN